MKTFLQHAKELEREELERQMHRHFEMAQKSLDTAHQLEMAGDMDGYKTFMAKHHHFQTQGDYLKNALNESFANDFLAMAKKRVPSAEIKSSEQRRKETDALMKQRQAAAANRPKQSSGGAGEKYPLGGYDAKSGRSYSEEVEAVVEMDNRTRSGDRREKRANSPEEIARREKKLQADLKKVSPEMRKKLRLPDPNDPKEGVSEGVAEGSDKNLNEMNPHLVHQGLEVLSNYPTATAVAAGAAGAIAGGAIIKKLVTKAWQNHKKLKQLKQDIPSWSHQKLHANKNVGRMGGKVAKIIQKEIERRKQNLPEQGVTEEVELDEAKDDYHYTDEKGNKYRYGASGYVGVVNKSGINQGQQHISSLSSVHKKNYEKLYGKQVKNEEIELDEVAAWQRKEGKNPSGGLNKKGIASYRRENPGSKLSMAVTTKPSKLKKGSKAWNRRKSFCARMSGMPGPMKDEKGRPTRKALSLRKWNC
jgi:hypothetical protein